MEKSIEILSNEEAIALYGSLDEHLKFAEKEFRVRISARNHRLKIIGNQTQVEKAFGFFKNRLSEIRKTPKTRTPERGASGSAGKDAQRKEGGAKPPRSPKGTPTTYLHRGKLITARSKNQEKYLAAIGHSDVVLGIGPAGTGKTYLAMAAALDHLKRKTVSRIILTRPAVEAGESLGFLPGDFAAKVNPYLRPLYDALHDMMDIEEASRYMDRGIIEVAPIAYMRGRTLNESFVILDEAQNCTHAQMKMFLTRLGVHSKMIVTGDITQIDLPVGKKSGLVEAQKLLGGISGIEIVCFDEKDVVRHPLVQEMIQAYERYERNQNTR